MPELWLKQAETVIVQIADDIGFVRRHHGAAMASCPELSKIGQDAWAHQMHQVRLEGLHPCKFLAVKSPVGQDDGHFRIERKGNGLKRHHVFLRWVRLVAGNSQKNLVPARAQVADKLKLGS